jgi:hypothetical protein
LRDHLHMRSFQLPPASTNSVHPATLPRLGLCRHPCHHHSRASIDLRHPPISYGLHHPFLGQLRYGMLPRCLLTRRTINLPQVQLGRFSSRSCVSKVSQSRSQRLFFRGHLRRSRCGHLRRQDLESLERRVVLVLWARFSHWNMSLLEMTR